MSGTSANSFVNQSTENAHYNALDFLLDQKHADLWTIILVKVVSSTSTGGLAVAGTVNVQPLVNMVDGAGNSTPHGIINGLPYLRIQGGANAVIIDPAAGDMGLAAFCQRDISAVVANRGQANPGSYRRFSPADGIYLGGVLNGVPTQYVQMNSTGMTLTTPGTLSLNAAAISTNGAWAHTGTVMMNGHVMDQRHEHTGVSSGSSNTGPVV